MNTFKDSSSVKINGTTFDFTGVYAELDNSFNIHKVTCLKTGDDLTDKYKKIYPKTKKKVSKDVFDMLVKVNGFNFVDDIFKVE